MNKNLLLFFGLSLGFLAQAQEHTHVHDATCGSTLQDVYRDFEGDEKALEAFKAEEKRFNQYVLEKAVSHANAKMAVDTAEKIVRTIPIVFHILHKEGSEKISHDQVLDQIETLNEDFRKQNANAVSMPDYFKQTADSTMYIFNDGDFSTLANSSRYLVFQDGPTDEEDLEFNIASGNKLIMYFYDETDNGAPTVDPANGETITSIGVDISDVNDGSDLMAEVKLALENEFSSHVNVTIEADPTDPDANHLVVVNKTNGTASNSVVGISDLFIAKINRATGGFIAADTRIQFALAKLDGEGNPTTGINYIYSDRSNLPDPSAAPIEGAVGYNEFRNYPKSVIQWDPTKYFNVWVVNNISSQGGGTILGFAQFPNQINYTPQTDGVILRSDYTGSIGNINFGVMGRTLSHEAGHWLGLIHIWGDDDTNDNGDQISDADVANAEEEDLEELIQQLSSGSDQVDDTPDQGNRTQNYCPTGLVPGELGSPYGDMYQNYMDYSNDNCMGIFTSGQTKRMRAAMDVYRSNIWSEDNLMATGVSDNFDASTLLPAVDFSISERIIKEGDNIQLKSLSTNTDGSTSYTWSFPGSNLSDETGNSENVTFSEPGAYTVKLEVTNANGTASKTVEDVIYVSPDITPRSLPIFANFTYYAEFSGPDAFVTSLSEDGQEGWNFYNDGGSPNDDANGCLRVASWKNDESEVQTLMFKPISTSGLSNANGLVSFDYAYVKRTPDNDDRFKILFRTSSTSNTWKTLYSSSTNPSEINTVKEEGMTTNDGSIVYALNYEPSDEEWKTVKIENIAAFRNKNFVEMKIEYFGRDGNYFYFDNLTIGNDIALTTDEFDFENSIELFPNPSKGNVNLTFNLGSDTELDLEVVDILGKSYGNLAKGFQAGEHQVSISEITSKLTSGVYFVNITKDQKTSTQKFVISK